MSNRTDLDYFEFQGKRYPLNTVVKIKKDFYTLQYKLGRLSDYPMVQVVGAFVDWKGISRLKYAIWMESGHIGYYITSEDIIESVVETPPKEPVVNTPRYYKDSEVKDVFIGWVLYVAFLLITLIFNSFYIFWGFGTVYFFSWRSKKLKKPAPQHGFDVEEKVREWNDRKARK